MQVEQRVWFNSELRSRNFLVPGLIAVIMTLIGALLTALVMAREWERGTMEALMVTPVAIREVLLGKLIPYFMLGMGGMVLSVVMAVWLFEVPLRGSLWVLLLTSALFLLVALGMGLLISITAKNQFVAGQAAIIVTFLPAFLLSGFIFDIGSMPGVVQFITHLIAARYFVAILQTLFLAGDVWSVILPNALALAAHGGGVPGPQPAPRAQAPGLAERAMWLQRILALVTKEFLALLKDPKSRFVIIGPPIIQLLVFGYAATFDLNHVPFAVYNEDTGDAARALVARFEGSPTFRLVAVLRNEGELAPLIDRRDALLVVHLGPRFSADLARGEPGTLQLIVDGRDSNTAMIVLDYAREIVARFNTDWLDAHGGGAPPAYLVPRAWFNPNLVSRWFIVPGIVGLLTLVVTMVVTALSVAREREQGTFDQLLVTPLRPVEILIGKAMPGFVIGLIEASVIIVLAVYWFEIPLRGQVLTLYLGILLFLLSAIGVGLMISSLAVTQQQGLLGAFLFLVPAVILSGFATPIANMPQAVQYLTLINPMRYFMVILRGVFLEDTPLALLVHQFWPMAVIGLVTLAFAGWLFRHRLY